MASAAPKVAAKAAPKMAARAAAEVAATAAPKVVAEAAPKKAHRDQGQLCTKGTRAEGGAGRQHRPQEEQKRHCGSCGKRDGRRIESCLASTAEKAEWQKRKESKGFRDTAKVLGGGHKAGVKKTANQQVAREKDRPEWSAKYTDPALAVSPKKQLPKRKAGAATSLLSVQADPETALRVAKWLKPSPVGPCPVEGCDGRVLERDR